MSVLGTTVVSCESTVPSMSAQRIRTNGSLELKPSRRRSAARSPCAEITVTVRIAGPASCGWAAAGDSPAGGGVGIAGGGVRGGVSGGAPGVDMVSTARSAPANGGRR